jgi:hypothetical protein
LEILIVQVNVLLFDQYREEQQGRQWHPTSPYRILILLVQNYIELVLLFALSNKLVQPLFNGLSQDDWIGALALAFNSMTSFGSSPAQAIGQIGQALLLVQGLVGAFVTLAVLARFVSLLPSPHRTNSA